MAIDRDEILRALEQVIDPELQKPVTELEMVREIEIEGPDVRVTIALTVAGCPLRNSFEEQVAEHVGTLPGVRRVELRFDVMSPEEKAELATRLRGGRPEKSISDKRSLRVSPLRQPVSASSQVAATACQGSARASAASSAFPSAR